MYGEVPSPREYFGMDYHQNMIIIFGGYTSGNHLNDMYYFKIPDKKWYQISDI